MTFQHNTSAFQSHQGDVQFDFGELFFSCTDERGVITAGNDVFQRVSGFEWDELLGAPHKTVRHPDMPKGLFHIFWDRIQKGMPTGAYVLNQCKDGRAYWVFAIISPIDGGYLSIRLKPSSDLFDKSRDLYKTALEKERDGLSAADSAAYILESLQKLGFDDYSSFGAHAISMETKARDAALVRDPNKLPVTLETMSQHLLSLSQEQVKLFEFFDAIRGIPSNMRIVASRLEPAGGPISAISQNYRLMSDEVQGHLDGFRMASGSKTIASNVSDQVNAALFLACMSQLLKELKTLSDAPKAETMALNDSIDEREIREKLLQNYSLDSIRAVSDASNEVLGLARSSKDLRQLVTGLDSIRVLCRVEAGRLGAESVTLTPVIDQLDKFHKEIDKSLGIILDYADKVTSLIDVAAPQSMYSVDRMR